MEKRHNRRVNIYMVLMAMIISLMILASMMVQSDSPRDFIEVRVERGDTLWSIARDNSSEGQDIRAMVYTIRQANALTSALITPGTTLRVPVTEP